MSVPPMLPGRSWLATLAGDLLLSDSSDSSVGVVAVHACGALTDAVLQTAVTLGAPVAVLPCCYTGMAAAAPSVLRQSLGVALAADVHRTYALERHGYVVDWAAIPAAITPMNRILVAAPRKARSADAPAAAEGGAAS